MGVYKLSGAGGLLTPRVNYTSMLAGNEAFTIPGDYELISTTVLGSAAPSVTFNVSSFANTYKHLQIRLVARGTASSVFQLTRLRYNGDTTSSYAGHELYSSVSSLSVASYGEANVSAMRLGWVAGGNAVANNFPSMVVDILEPFSSTKNTTSRAIGGIVNTGGNINQLHSGLYNKIDSITSATIDANGDNFVSGSRFSIYGIRG